MVVIGSGDDVAHLDTAQAVGEFIAQQGWVLVSGGKDGSLSEMAYAWRLGKPLIACAFTGGWSERLAGSLIDDRQSGEVYPARSLEEVYALLKKILQAVK